MKKCMILLLLLLICMSGNALGETQASMGSVSFFTNNLCVIQDSAGRTALVSSSNVFLVPWSNNAIELYPLTPALTYIIVENIGQTKYLYDSIDQKMILVPQDLTIPANSCIEPPYMVFCDTTKTYGYISETGALIIECSYDSASTFKDGLAYVTSKEFSGYIDSDGQKVIKAKSNWNYGNPFYEDVAIVQTQTGITAIDKEGHELFEMNDGYLLEYYVDGYYLSRNENDQYIYIDHNGHSNGQSWQDARPFTYGYAAVQNEKGKWGFLNDRLDLIIPCQFDSVDWYYDKCYGFDKQHIAWVEMNGNQYMIDEYGNKLTSKPYQYIPSFNAASCDLSLLGSLYIILDPITEKYGAVNSKGELVLPTIYDSISVIGEDQYGLKLNRYTFVASSEGSSYISISEISD